MRGDYRNDFSDAAEGVFAEVLSSDSVGVDGGAAGVGDGVGVFEFGVGFVVVGAGG